MEENKQKLPHKLPKYLKVEPECINRINQLHPSLISQTLDIYYDCRKNCIPLYILWTKRNNQEQDFMYRFGRTLPGTIITTKRGGYSPHNYGLAIDFCFRKDNRFLLFEDIEHYPRYRQFWMDIVFRFEALGWTSGWRWPSYEPGHVENLLGKTIIEYKNEQNKKDWIDGFGYV